MKHAQALSEIDDQNSPQANFYIEELYAMIMWDWKDRDKNDYTIKDEMEKEPDSMQKEKFDEQNTTKIM